MNQYTLEIKKMMKLILLNNKHAFINNTFDVIKETIKEKLDYDNNILDINNIIINLNKQKKQYHPKYFFVNSYNKISHIITNNNYIIPVIPNGIITYNNISFIYDNWNNIKKTFLLNCY